MAAAIAADWRDAAVYQWLTRADRSCFAWEWLRRTGAYRDACASPRIAPAQFGLLRFEDPACDALVARPIWLSAVDRAVLRGVAHAADGPGCFDLALFERLATVGVGEPGSGVAEYVLLSDGLRSIRFDLMSGTLLSGPVFLRWRIDGLADVAPQLLALRRLIAFARLGGFAASLHGSERRARRWIQMLRVHDARCAGASYRDIVPVLFAVDVSGSRWRSTAPTYRLRVQRLVAGARTMASGRWRIFLDPAAKSPRTM